MRVRTAFLMFGAAALCGGAASAASSGSMMNLIPAARFDSLTPTADTTPCTGSSTALCIDDQPGDRRFEARVHFSSPDRGFNGDGTAIDLSSLGISQGGAFSFFSSANPEMLLKVLNGCSLGNHFWVFFAAVTDVGFTVTVRDTFSGVTRTYSNADHNAADPVQDTSAFAACPEPALDSASAQADKAAAAQRELSTWAETRKSTPVPANFGKVAVGSTSTIPCNSVCFGDSATCNMAGTLVLDEDVSAPFSIVNLRIHNGQVHVPADCTGTPVSGFPVSLAAGQTLLIDFKFAPTAPGNFTDTLNISTLEWAFTGSTPTVGSACVANSTTLCIDEQPGDRRFKLRVQYSSPDRGLTGDGAAVPLSSVGIAEGGAFAFFSSSNPEMLVKVLNGCGLGNHYWVFFAAVTDVGFTVTVTDTLTGTTRTYSNADHQAAIPVQDTSAFTCP
jgi:hypothetical protein